MIEITSLDATDPASAPRVGLFWALPLRSGPWGIVSASQLQSAVPEIAGFQTLDLGHVDVWPRIRREAGSQVRGEYEEFPRGRVNWRREDGRFLLLLDRSLNRPTWRTRLLVRFGLPAEAVLVMTDPHYRSIHRPPGNQSAP